MRTPAKSSRRLLAALLAGGLAAGLALAPMGCGAARRGGNVKTETERVQEGDELISSAGQHRSAGDLDSALRDLERAIELNPELTQAHMEVGDIWRERGDYGKALDSYVTVTRLEPRNFDGHYKSGLMLHLLNRVSEAISAYLRALELRPDDFNANLALATAYYQFNELDQALPYGERAVRIDPRSGPARFNLGAIYAARGQHREAVTEYYQATELMPLSPELLLNLADSLGRLDRYEEMRNTLDQLVRTQPSAAAYERRGFAHFKLREFDAALADFNNALAIDRDYHPALNGVGVSMLNRWLGSPERSDLGARRTGLQALRRSLQIEPDQPRVRELLERYD